MDNNVHKLITHGIGPHSDAMGLMTMGLNANPVFSALSVFGIDSRERVDALDVDRETVYIADVELQFEDGEIVYFEDGNPVTYERGYMADFVKVKSRIGNLAVQ